MGRSSEYPTHYKVGVLNGKDVYLHPQMGLSIKRGDRLVEMTSEELEAWQQKQLRHISSLAEEAKIRQEALDQ